VSTESLDGKVYVVTGGTQGIGEGVARAVARAGAAGVVVCGRDEERGRRVAAALGESGCRGVFVRADMAREADCREVVAACDATFARLDGLVNGKLKLRGRIVSTDRKRAFLVEELYKPVD